MYYVKVNDKLYPAIITGKLSNKNWDERESKMITTSEDFNTINEAFIDGVSWSIVNQIAVTKEDEEGNPIEEIQETEYDNSEYNVRGDLIIHPDGSCSIEMGKPTALESAYELMYGGVN